MILLIWPAVQAASVANRQKQSEPPSFAHSENQGKPLAEEEKL